MRADNSRFLRAAAEQRRAQTAQRAAAAIRRLDTAGQPITFTAVAQTAGVSRSWLYRDPIVRAEVQRLRQARPAAPPSPPAAQRGTTESWQHRCHTLLEANRQLVEDNQLLRDQVAALLGERRAERTHGRPPPDPASP
jgi:Family of unknown function (DUF6262)